jgi:arginase family enzyme
VRPLLLHLDDALTRQPRLLAATAAAGARTIEAQDLGPSLRLWARPKALTALRDRLAPSTPEPELVFAGSGDFHNVSPLLIERALTGVTEPVTVVHFDNHPDWVKFDNGEHCGSWVGTAARLPGVAKVVTVGVCSGDIRPAKHKGAQVDLVAAGALELYPWRDPDVGAATVSIAGRTFPTIEALGEAAFLDLLDARVETAAIYVTLDKDVLRPEDAGTNWDQGLASLAFVEAAIARLASTRRLVGADIFGDWSPALMGGGVVDRWVKRIEGFLDHPAPAADRDGEIRRNEQTNLRLLALLGAAA